MASHATPDVLTARVARFALIIAVILAATAFGARFWNQPKPPAAAIASGNQPADATAAITAMEAQVKASPNDAAGWNLLGSSYLQVERFADAAAAYRRATALAPREADYWSSLGEALIMSGSGSAATDAQTAFDKAIAIDPTNPRARYFINVARDLRGDHAGAIDGWFALLADTPTGAPWIDDVRRTIEQVGRKNRIDISARLAAVEPPVGTVQPNTAGVAGLAGSQAVNAGSPGTIAAMVDRLAAKLKVEPRNVDGWIMLMRSYATLGRGADAATAYRTGKAANPAAARTLDAAAATLGIAR